MKSCLDVRSETLTLSVFVQEVIGKLLVSKVAETTCVEPVAGRLLSNTVSPNLTSVLPST